MDTDSEDPTKADETPTVAPPPGSPTAPTAPAAPPSRPARAEPPKRIGDFEIVRELARGGMGVVYVARHADLDRLVALKVLLARERASEQERERFRVEARAAAKLRHPGIVAIHDVGEANGQPYFSMDFIEGESLKDRLTRDGPMASKVAAGYAHRLAEALAYAHSRAILHRDIKPANVLLDGDDRPVLTDFGLAKDVERREQGLTQTGQVMGTPAYMPPEQAAGELERVDRRADIYSLGATLYEMVVGKPPFEGATTYNVLTAVITRDAVPPRRLRREIDRDLETICMKCLEKEPEDRYGSASELAKDLGRYLANESILARPPSSTDHVRKWVRRNPLQARLTVLVAIMLTLGAFLFHKERLEQERMEWAIYYVEAVEKGTPMGFNMYGRELESLGYLRKASLYYRKAAQKGNTYGMYNLARLHESNDPALRDEAEALRWYRKALEAGFAKAGPHAERLQKRLPDLR